MSRQLAVNQETKMLIESIEVDSGIVLGHRVACQYNRRIRLGHLSQIPRAAVFPASRALRSVPGAHHCLTLCFLPVDDLHPEQPTEPSEAMFKATVNPYDEVVGAWLYLTAAPCTG